MDFETGRFYNRIPYIKGGCGEKTMVFFYGASALLTSLETSSLKDHLQIMKAYVPEGYTYYVFGYEQNPAKAYKLNEIADEFAGIIRENIGKTVIVGISFGGFVAMRFAARHPALTDRLVLLISAHKFSDLGEQKISKMKSFARTGRYYELLKENILLFRRYWLNILAGLLLWLAKKNKLCGLNSPGAIIDCLEGLFTTEVCDNVNYLGEICAPSLVIGGTQDQFFGVEEFAQTARGIPEAKLQLFNAETHMLPIERNTEVAAAVKKFLAAEQI